MRGVGIVLMVLLAGCLTPTSNEVPGEGSEEAAPVTSPLRLDDCIHQLAFVGVPEEEAAAHLPEGFAPVLLADGLAQLIVLATACASVDNVTGDMHELLFALGVTPPAELARDDAAFHGFYTHLVTDHASAWVRYSAWDVPGQETSVTMDVAAGAGTGTTEAAGARFTTTVAGPPSDGAAGAVRIFTEGAGGLGAIDYDFTAYRLALGGATLEDAEGVAGFGDLHGVGYGAHEWGDGYGLILTRTLF